MHPTRNLVVVAFALPFISFAQNLSIGLIGGVSATDATRDLTDLNHIHTYSPSKDWIAGAAFELHLRSNLSLEADAMYRELHAKWAFIEPDGTPNSVSPANVVTWEIPILVKYHFRIGGLNPFIEAGPSFRTTGNLNFNPSHHGVTAGVGIERHLGAWSLAPQVRYTRWAADSFLGTPRSEPNQVELLLSVSHSAESHASPLGSRLALGAIFGWGLTDDIRSFNQTYNFIQISGTTETQVTETQNLTGLRDPLVGPVLEVALVNHLSAEVDAVYKPYRNRIATTIQGGAPIQPFTFTTSRTWQFPVLAKYRLAVGGVHPFVEAGPSFRIGSQYLSNHGVTAGAGVEMRWRALHIAPGLRYTHWAGPVFGGAQYVRNEASVVLTASVGGPK